MAGNAKQYHEHDYRPHNRLDAIDNTKWVNTDQFSLIRLPRRPPNDRHNGRDADTGNGGPPETGSDGFLVQSVRAQPREPPHQEHTRTPIAYPNASDSAEMIPCINADRGSRLDPRENHTSTRPPTRPGTDKGPNMTEKNDGVERDESVTPPE
jgi:hypothetical protein